MSRKIASRAHGFSINTMICGAGKDAKDMLRTGDYDLPAAEISIYTAPMSIYNGCNDNLLFH